MYRIAISMMLLGSIAAVAPAQGAKPPVFSDENIAKAIEKGTAFLWAQQKPDGSWAPFGDKQYITGPGALAILALLESGVSPQDPQMEKALDWLRKTPESKTYCLGIRCNVWLAANAQTGSKYNDEFQREVAQLVKSTADGSYGYDSAGDGHSTGDNSNSQYGLYGAWAGALGNAEIDPQYWLKVQNHWFNTQNYDGGWSYGGNGASSATMTAAGVASMFIVLDNLYTEAFSKCDVKQDIPETMTRGLTWLENNFAPSIGAGAYYFLYGVERVGLASGYKYFGAVDWYKAAGSMLLATQNAATGEWGGGYGPVVDTSFAMLFLIRGRHAVVFDKLEYKGDWNNRPRALAWVCRAIGTRFENPVSWQIINLKAPVADWHDAPLLFISGSKAPEFSDEDIAKLRTFVFQGGTILSVTECDGAGFNKGIREIYAKMFPEYELKLLPKGHEIYSFYSKATSDKVKFYAITNGLRPLVIHTDNDLTLAWQLNKIVSEKWAFDAVVNVAFYVTDKTLAPRGTMTWPDDPNNLKTPNDPNKPSMPSVKLARLKWAGNYDPEPLAYELFSRLMRQGVGLGGPVLDACNPRANVGGSTTTQGKGLAVTVLGPMEVSELPASGAKIATLTGVGELKVGDQDKEILKKFVDDGGLLVIDAAGGNKAFAASAQKLLESMYGRDEIRTADDLAILDLPGCSIEAVRYRRRTAEKLQNRKKPNFHAVMVGDRIGVIFSKEDLTAGLVGCTASTIDGYTPASAYAIMRNAVAMAVPQALTSQPAAAAGNPANATAAGAQPKTAAPPGAKSQPAAQK